MACLGPHFYKSFDVQRHRSMEGTSAFTLQIRGVEHTLRSCPADNLGQLQQPGLQRSDW